MRSVVLAHSCAAVPALRPKLFLRLLLACTCAGLGACAYIPNAGPLVQDVRNEYDADAAQHPFVLQQVSGRTIEVLKQRQAPSLAPLAVGDAAAPELEIGSGDVLGVTIWEAGSQPLFASAAPSAPAQTTVIAGGASRGVTLPDLVVGNDGCVSIPFAGRVPVAGRTLPAAQAAIEAALHGKAQQPQVLASFVRSPANSVTVVGEVTGGGRIPLSDHGDRILDVLASAGGIRVPTYETWIGLSRGGVTTSVPLTQVLADTRENIVLHAGDALLVTRQPETFTVFGATGHNAQIAFEAGHINLIQAVAKAGGLDDSRADPRGVFLLRREPRPLADALAGSDGVGGTEPTVPVVYQLDLMRANSYFLASDFEVRSGDVLFVSSAPATELQKFLLLVGLIVQPAISAAVTANAVK